MSKKGSRKLTKKKSFDLPTATNSNSINNSYLINRSIFNLEKSPKFILDINKKVTPQNINDLATHSKKIEEVQGWIKYALNMISKTKTTQFLLITGPAGSGKSITVQTICKSNNITLTEWLNPMDVDFEVFKGPGQVTKFCDFLMESKYCSLFDTANANKVLMIKEFPNTFFRNPQDFFNVLDKCYYKAKYPIIFICSESSVNETNVERILFPEEIQLKYAISKISFNSCAPTLLKKALKRAQDLLQYKENQFNCVSASTIDEIVKSSLGDIRTAMNQLYMIGLVGCENAHNNLNKNEKHGIKRKRTNHSMPIKNVERDESLGLFHGLGRVLNPKRIETGSSWRLNCNIDKLIDEFGGMPSTFIDFLFENYLKYFGDLDDVQKSSEILSLSRGFMNSWDNSDCLNIGLWMAILGLMIFNEHKVSKWNQINVLKKIEPKRPSKERIDPTDMFYHNIIKKAQPPTNVTA